MDNQNDRFDEFINDEGEIDDSEFEQEIEDSEDVELRTVVLMKNEMLALLGLKQTPAEGTIVRIDPRQPIASTQRYDNAAAALKWFNRSLATSKRNGWEVVFDGSPIYG